MNLVIRKKFDLHQKKVLIWATATLLNEKIMESELYKVRREKLIFLLTESGDNKREMSAKTGIAATQISMFVSSVPSRRRVINHKQARKIEEAYGKPVLWLDTPNQQKVTEAPQTNHDEELEALINSVLHGVKIARAEIKAQGQERQLSREEKEKLLIASIEGNIKGRITEEQFGAIVNRLL